MHTASLLWRPSFELSTCGQHAHRLPGKNMGEYRAMTDDSQGVVAAWVPGHSAGREATDTRHATLSTLKEQPVSGAG